MNRKKKALPLRYYGAQLILKMSEKNGFALVAEVQQELSHHPRYKGRKHEDVLKSIDNLLHGGPAISPVKKVLFRQGMIVAPIFEFNNRNKHKAFKVLDPDSKQDKVLFIENVLRPSLYRIISGTKNHNLLLTTAIETNLLPGVSSVMALPTRTLSNKMYLLQQGLEELAKMVMERKTLDEQ